MIGWLMLVCWVGCAVPDYRLAYVAAYESHNGYWRGAQNEYNTHHKRHMNGVGMGLLAMLGGPLTMLPLLVVRLLSPVAPTRAAEVAAEAAALEAENAARLDAVERELHIGPYRLDPLEKL